MFALPEDNDNLDYYDEPRLHMERLMKVRLVEFDISMRILIPLDNAGIKTLGDLTSKSVRDLTKVPRLGATAIGTLIRLLAGYGLRLT